MQLIHLALRALALALLVAAEPQARRRFSSTPRPYRPLATPIASHYTPPPGTSGILTRARPPPPPPPPSPPVAPAPSRPLLPDAAYTSQMLDMLWAGIQVQVAAVTTVGPATPLPSSELAPPPDREQLNPEKPGLPANFLWGVAGSSYQLEGAVKAEGRGPSIWDTLSHKVPGFVVGNDNGDVAANHYYVYKQDIQRLKDMGIKSYSLSISWSRIFPLGTGAVNEAGLKHYIDVIQELNAQQIVPVVTLYHWDLPQFLQDKYGGWINGQIVDDFANFARTVYRALIPLGVRNWVTINEPEIFCQAYEEYANNPAIPRNLFNTFDVPNGQVRYRCGHHALLAHAVAAKILREEFGQYRDNRVSIKLAFSKATPRTNTTDDIAAAERATEFSAGWLAHPLHQGDYPSVMKTTLGGLLPRFTADQIALVKGSTDYFAWGGYTGGYSFAPVDGFNACTNNPRHPQYPVCALPTNVDSNGWIEGNPADPGASWLYSTPKMFRESLRYIFFNYRPQEIWVAEFGFADFGESQRDENQARYDQDRVDYFEKYLDAILGAVNEDRIPVTAAFGWAMMDNFEWTQGYGPRFGLQYVNYGTQERFFKKSLFYFRDFFTTHVGKGRS